MPAIVAPGICRYAINSQYFGRPVVNVLDIEIDTTGSVEDRATACFSQAGIILNEWRDHILPNLVGDFVTNSVSWVDLDSLTGSTGERSSTSEVTYPQNGDLAQSPMPGNVAVRVLKNTVPVRGQRQGRMYLCGVPESATSVAAGNTISGTYLTDLQDDLESFLGNVNQEEAGPTGYQSHIAVVHTVNDEYQSHTLVTDLTAETLLASQRRRLRG